MNTKRKTILFLITLITLLITLTCINATENITTNTTTSTDNTDNINHETPKTLQKQIQSDEKTNNKKIIINKNTTTKKTPKTYTQYAYGYQDLYNKVQSTKNNYYSYNDVSIYLQQGNYNITQPINWGNSNTKTLKIYANNNLFDARNQTNFITVEKGYTLELYNFKIRYAEATRGSVIYNKGTVNIYDSIFLNSTASSNGGVIYNDHGKVKILNSSFSNNKATNGACIYNNNGTVNLTKNYFSFNKAQRGGVNYNIGELNITSSTFKNNQATQNGGCNYNDKNTLTILKSNFQNNKATNYGGVNYNNKGTYYDTPVVYFNESQAINNYATNGGVNANYGELTIKSSNLNNNNATRGGVNYNFNYIEIIKSTFKNNKVTTNGGVNYNDNAYFDIKDSSFITNMAENGGVNYNNQGSMEIKLSKNNLNTATRGGVNYNNGYLYMNYTNFTQNKAKENGGVNYNDKYGSLYMEDTESLKNTAKRAGNIYCNNYGYFNISYCRFEDDKSTYDGDMIINYGSDCILEHNTLYNKNVDNTIQLYTTKKIQVLDNEFRVENKNINMGQTKKILSPIKDTSPYKKTSVDYILPNRNYDECTTVYLKSDNTFSVNYKFNKPGLSIIDIYYDNGVTHHIRILQEVIPPKIINVGTFDDLQEIVGVIGELSVDKNYVINITKNIKLEDKIDWSYSDSIRSFTIKGNNHIIDGQNKTRFIDIGAGFTLNIENLKIQNCQTSDEDVGNLGGASFGSIGNNGTLNIKNSEFKDNYWCGAIVNNGILSVEKTKFVDMGSDEIILNSRGATARIHYSNFTNDYGYWSIIENYGDLYIDHSKFDKNNVTECYIISNCGYINLNYNNFTNNYPGDYPEIAIIKNYEYDDGSYPYGYITNNIFRNNYFRYYVDNPYYSLTLSGNIFD
ncbi:hypothetical protein [Methanosphaera cuniculi]|uniref:hypothetical protein n=1 Tax=Methanosphaera cuniculi TaxID=1077256 RepID=UPI0026DD5025|nr:hypothetical protein [Methanosphaera cuniculi]